MYRFDQCGDFPKNCQTEKPLRPNDLAFGRRPQSEGIRACRIFVFGDAFLATGGNKGQDDAVGAKRLTCSFAQFAWFSSLYPGIEWFRGARTSSDLESKVILQSKLGHKRS